MEKRQVFDLPPMTVEVTEHQLIARRCACGATTCGTAPQGVSAPVQYGPRITAIVLYLYVGQFLSKKRAAQALAELFGTPLSEGTVAAMSERAADGLDGFLDALRERIVESTSAGFDETGLRVAGKLHWVQCARTGRYTLITCHTKRGREGIDDAGVLARFFGVAVHDAWAPYDTFIEPEHQLCCAHALRELQGVADAAPPGSDWCWAGQVADALVAMQQLVAEAIETGTATIDPDALSSHIRLYRSAAQIGVTETAARSDKLMKKHNALARRLLERQDDYLRFTTDWRIPPDNNGSERDIRMIKLRQKVSGCLRTLTGAKTLLRHPRHARRRSALAARGHLTSYIGTSSPMSFCDSSGLLRICAERSAEESMAAITADTNSSCRSGLAENCGKELFCACCCRVSLSSSWSLMWVTTLRTLESLIFRRALPDAAQCGSAWWPAA